MSLYYLQGCSEATADYQCIGCPSPSLAVVRGVILLHESVNMVDVSNLATWQTAIENGLAIVIPKTSGNYDGGTPNYGTGKGDVAQKYVSSTFKAQYNDDNYNAANMTAYNAIRKNTVWRFCWRNEKYMYISDKAATIVAKDPHENDYTKNVEFVVDVEFTQVDNPIPHPIPTGLFSCVMAIAV